MKLHSPFRVPPHSHIKLAKLSTVPSGSLTEKDSEAVLKKHREQLDALQEVFYAAQSRAMLIVLAMCADLLAAGAVARAAKGRRRAAGE